MKLQLCIFTWLLNCRLERINKIDRDYSYLQFFSLVCPPEIPRFYPTILNACTDSGYPGEGPGLGPNGGLMDWKKIFEARPPPHPPNLKVWIRHWYLRVARLDFCGGYLPSLSIKCVGVSKDMGKRLPRLFMKIKIPYDLGFIAIGVTMAT